MASKLTAAQKKNIKKIIGKGVIKAGAEFAKKKAKGTIPTQLSVEDITPKPPRKRRDSQDDIG